MANNLAGPPTAAFTGALLVWLKQKTFAIVNAQTCVDYSFTIPESFPEMLFQVYMPFLDANLNPAGAWCSVAGTVKVRICNPTSGNITPSVQDLVITSK